MPQKKDINLIPHDVVMKGNARKRILLWSGIIFLVLIVLSGFSLMEKKKIGTVEGLIADLTLKKAELEQKISRR